MTIFSTTQHTVSDGILRLAITGEVDLSTADLLTDAITNVINAARITGLIIDLDQVTFLSAAGIHSLVRGYHLAAEFGIAYLVTNPHGVVYRVLDITGVLRVLAGWPQPLLPLQSAAAHRPRSTAGYPRLPVV